MEQVTLGQIGTFLTWIIALGTSVGIIIKALKRVIENGFKPIYEKIDKVDMNATKNFLVRSISDIDRGNKLDSVNKMRFYEQYEHYKELGGNSFIKEEVERLKKENKI